MKKLHIAEFNDKTESNCYFQDEPGYNNRSE